MFTQKQKVIKYCSFLFLILNAVLSRDQDKPNLKSSASFFPHEKTKVLVVGTFHLDYPNLDVIKIADKDKLEVSLKKRGN